MHIKFSSVVKQRCDNHRITCVSPFSDALGLTTERTVATASAGLSHHVTADIKRKVHFLTGRLTRSSNKF